MAPGGMTATGISYKEYAISLASNKRCLMYTISLTVIVIILKIIFIALGISHSIVIIELQCELQQLFKLLAGNYLNYKILIKAKI